MYRLRKMRRAGALRLFGRALYDGAGETRRCRRNRRRFAGLLCRSQRVALRPARPCVLFLREVSCLQARHSGRRMPPGRGERDVRPAEQILYDYEHAGRSVAVLEQRPRTSAGRGPRRRRGAADDARAGPQHGPPAEGGLRRWRPKPRCGSGRILSGSGARPDAERWIECVADVYEGSLAPFFVARTSSGVLPLYCPRIQRGAEKPEKISAGGSGFMEKNDNLPP